MRVNGNNDPLRQDSKNLICHDYNHDRTAGKDGRMRYKGIQGNDGRGLAGVIDLVKWAKWDVLSDWYDIPSFHLNAR